jgi:molybdate transport system permease protein
VPLAVQVEKKLANFELNVSFESGDSPLGILGPSGSGKTMLLRCIAGLERPDRGKISLNGRTLFDSEKGTRVPARDRRAGMLFQHYALFPHLTVAQNVGFALNSLPREEREKRVATALRLAHASGLENRRPRELSGGEQQRVALARALSIEPQALLLDEPLSALDTHLRSQIEALLQETFASYRRPALVVTHNIEEAYRLGENLLVLSQGQVAAFGPKESIFRHPPTLEVARLTGCKNFSPARAISATQVEATAWNCRLRTSDLAGSDPGAPIAYVGLRAHHIDFVEPGWSLENVFPCWLVRSSETPFRRTLYLHLHTAPAPGDEPTLQAEVFNEKWEHFRNRPLPWHVHLPPEALFTLPG